MNKVIIKRTDKSKISEIIKEIFIQYGVSKKVYDKVVLVKPNLIGAFPPAREGGIFLDYR